MTSKIHTDICAAAVRIIAWAYLLLHLDLTFGTVNVLPDWAGYLLILDALPALAKEESSASLLKPLCIILALWEGSILKLRTVRTILLTLTFLPQYLSFPDSMHEGSAILLIGINLVVAYFLCRALFSLCGSLTPDAQEERDG